METIRHTTGVGRALAQGDYTLPHNQVAYIVQHELKYQPWVIKGTTNAAL
jgi:hypothetical protein